jgi:hypothetical protein
MQPDDLGDLTPELRLILNDWDPIGVADISPSEYDGLNGSVLGCLGRSSDLASFAECFADVSRGFCPDTDEVDAMATKLFGWFVSKQRQQPKGDAQRAQLRKGRRWRSSHWKT